MSLYTAKVYEFLEGLRGGNYYFIIEGNKLVHISRYGAISKKVNNIAYYDVDLSKLKGKTVVEVMSSNNGLFDMVWIYPAEDLAVDWYARRRQELPITIINNYELVHLGGKERLFLDEWNKYYKIMLNYIIKEVIEKGGRIISTNLVDIHIKNDLKYPASFLIPYSQNARFRDLSVLTKQIHQIWIIIRILREFLSLNFDLYFEQSPYSPITLIGSYSLWYEFDLNPHTMCRGIL
jgi:hypothetical protein